MKEYFDAQNVSGIDRSEKSLRSRWSTINSDCQKWAAAQKAVDKINPSGTNEDDRDDEKWKKREDLDDLHLSNKRKRTIELNDDEEEDDASSDDVKRSPTPNSVSYSKPKRPDGCKKDKTEKKKRKGDDELTNAMEAIVKARKEANEVRKMARNQDAAAEERRLAAEERRVTVEERKVALEERKMGLEERAKLLEWEKHLFFLDTSLFNDAQKEYVNLVREEVLIQKRAMIRGMGGGGLGAMGGGGLGGIWVAVASAPWEAWVASEPWDAWVHLRPSWEAWVHLRPWVEGLSMCLLTHIPMKMPLKILPTPSELHVMRCVMRLGRKIHLRRWKNRLRKMRTKTRKMMIDVSFIYVLNFISLYFELGWMNLWA
ncbi:UDP-glycosyltransferase 73C6 [Hordeum vulgare]|nr:UDP-glycosyltransferase 73C6 [Hordeum vulgare]